MFEPHGLHRTLRPLEGHGVLIAGIREPVDGFAHLARVGRAEPAQHRLGEDAEPDLDLVQPRCVRRRVVKTHLRMTCQPPVVFGFVGAQVVQDDMEFLVRVLVSTIGKPRQVSCACEQGSLDANHDDADLRYQVLGSSP